ncbi:MAG TPA: M48 family metallopeptidase [Usitatibacter sp.]|nr:M48 family metallopeptidase [Usitatibacter sp.]
MRSIAAIILAAAATVAASPAHSFCREIKEPAPAAEADFLGIPASYAENSWRAYKGIAAAARVELPFVICRSNEPNAAAIEYGGRRVILITTALLDLAKGDVDEIAAVLGHEFGHILHKHIARKRDNAARQLETVKREAGRMVRGGVAVPDAVDAAKDLFKDRVMAFSRAAEREADDQGFALTQVAGFDPSGARRFFERMAKVTGDEARGGWFATHPGWQERITYSAGLEVNESFRRLAEIHVKNPSELRRIVLEWERAMPGSGAAAYYRSWLLSQTEQSPALVSGALEDAVLNFDGEGLSAAGQSHQAERSAATLALCVALYKEGRKHNAVSCVRRLDNDDVEQFRKITGWDGIILVGPRRERPGNLYGSRSDANTITLMNCKRDAEVAGLQPVRSWKGMRPAKPGAAEVMEAQVCSPDMCNCETVDLAQRYPHLFRK